MIATRILILMKPCKTIFALLLSLLCFFSCCETSLQRQNATQPVYKDVPFLKDYAIKFYASKETSVPKRVCTDRNGVVQILTSTGLHRPYYGHFQHPGTLLPDKTYRPMAEEANLARA
jgi:hypothetical protein